MNSAVFIDRLKAVLTDNNGVRMHPHKTHGTALDTPHLALADAGCRRIFSQPERRMFRDYHIHLLIDVSGSMDGSRIRYATIATHALEYALSSAGAVMSASMFNRHYTPLKTADIKNIDKLYCTMRKACQTEGSGCTHTAYAIDKACSALNTATRSPSRIILVITDGGACCSSTCGEAGGDQVPRYSREGLSCRRSILEARQSCSVLALGIEDSNLAVEVFGRQEARSIVDITKLYPEALSLLASAVKRG